MNFADLDLTNPVDRRVFLKGVAGLTAGLMLGPDLALADESSDALGKVMPTRRLGRHNLRVTMLGIGGSHFMGVDERTARQIVDTTIEQGCRFIDTAESYGNGRSESRIGQLFTPKYRDHLVYMTKTRAKDAQTARKHLEESLKRLNTDYLDIWQIHAIQDPGDVDRRLDNGVLDFMLQARQQGKVKYLGFTGHTRPEAHTHMLKRLDERGLQLDTVQMPINVVDPSFNSFVNQVVPPANERGYGILAMKTLAYGRLVGGQAGWGRHRAKSPDAKVVPDLMTLDDALSFVWSLPVCCLISGTDTPAQLKQNIDIARKFAKMNQAQLKRLVEAAADHAGHAVEFYKA